MKHSGNIRLGVNLDHVATIRQARFTPYPDLMEAVRIAERAGAEGITLHLREDRRHIQTEDVFAARKIISTSLNLEMAATEEMTEIAQEIRPDYCCIVPERREELTTEGGLNVIGNLAAITKTCHALRDCEIEISLFIDPDIATIDAVMDTGAQLIELHTGQFANASGDAAMQELRLLIEAAEYAATKGLLVNAGHGIDYENIYQIVKIPHLNELNIGHSIVARAIFSGLSQAVTDMKNAIDVGSST